MGIVTIEVGDYSVGFPGAQALIDAKFGGAVRYVYPGRIKSLTAKEFAEFKARDFPIAIVMEDMQGNWQKGKKQGGIDARIGRDYANQCGFPEDRPLYNAIDLDVVSARDFNTMLLYMEGAANALGGPHLTGVYGEYDVIDAVLHAGVGAWFWQTKAWSHGLIHPANHLYQTGKQRYAGSVLVDINVTSVDNWGQHNAGADMNLSDKVPFDSPDGNHYDWTVADLLNWTNYRVNQTQLQVDAIAGSLDTWELQVLTAIRAIPAGAVPTDAQMVALQNALGPALVNELVKRLGA